MAMFNCPECGKEISDKANTCPNCGCPLKNKKMKKKDNTVKKNALKRIFLKLFIIIIIINIGVIGIYFLTEKSRSYKKANVLPAGKCR